MPSQSDLAYARLGVTEEDTLAQPQITPQLRMIAKTIQRAGQPKRIRRVRTVNTGVDSTDQIESSVTVDDMHAVPYSPGADLITSWPSYLHASDDSEAKKVISVYYSVPGWVRSALPVEAFCLASTVSTSRVLEILTGVCVRLGAQASTIIAAVSHPSVVQHNVERALDHDGEKWTEMLHRATGFIPVPKGSQTNITVTQNASASTAVAVSAPSPETTIRTLAEAFNQRRGLAPTSTADALPPVRDTLDVPAHELIAVEAECDNEEDE